MNNTYTIKDIINLLLSHIWLIILITLIGGGAAYSYSRFVLPLEYSSHITMYVQSYTGISENTNNVNNISNSKQLVNTYMEVLKDDAVMNAVSTRLMNSFDEQTIRENFAVAQNGSIVPSSLRSCLAISSVTDTSAVKVTATAKNAEVAAAICNDLTKVAPKYVEDAVGVGSINTIDTAKVYNTPVAPNVIKNTALGLIAGMMLIVLLLFVIDFFDNTVKDADALSEKYNKAIIGEVHTFGDSRKKKNDENEHRKLTDEETPFDIIESYKSIRTNLTFALSTVEKKVFAVSSPNPGEGKSTTSANIAIAMAQGGSKVLLIDADMRKSVQHRIFELKNKKGLSTVASKMHKAEECIHKNVMENLDVLTSGPIPPNPSELLASETMASVIEKLSEEYDVIIIDTPPVNVVTDAMELAKIISGIVVVLRYGKTTEEDIDNVIKKVEFANMNMLGFIINGEKTKRGGFYSGYYSKKGYGYDASLSETEDDDGASKDNDSKKDTSSENKSNKKNKNKGK